MIGITAKPGRGKIAFDGRVLALSVEVDHFSVCGLSSKPYKLYLPSQALSFKLAAFEICNRHQELGLMGDGPPDGPQTQKNEAWLFCFVSNSYSFSLRTKHSLLWYCCPVTVLPHFIPQGGKFVTAGLPEYGPPDWKVGLACFSCSIVLWVSPCSATVSFTPDCLREWSSFLRRGGPGAEPERQPALLLYTSCINKPFDWLIDWLIEDWVNPVLTTTRNCRGCATAFLGDEGRFLKQNLHPRFSSTQYRVLNNVQCDSCRSEPKWVVFKHGVAFWPSTAWSGYEDHTDWENEGNDTYVLLQSSLTKYGTKYAVKRDK